MSKVFQIFEHPELGRRAVKVGFSWPAWFFPPFWPFIKKLWFLGLGCVAVMVLLAIGEELAGGPSNLWWSLFDLGTMAAISILYGMCGNRWIENSLLARGFYPIRIVATRTRGKALDVALGPVPIEALRLSPVRRYGPLATVLSYTLILLGLRAAFVAYYIPSPAMLDTLQINDRLFVNRFAYAFDNPMIGDIFVFRVPESIPGYDPNKRIWIKRVVGVAGDRVAIENGRLLVNGNPVETPEFLARNRFFSKLQGGAVFEETLVPEGHVLLFGDNSGNSYDGRYWGPIEDDRIIGKAVFRFWPPLRFGRIEGESVLPLAED